MTFVNYIEESVPAVAAGTPEDEASIAAAATAIASRNRKNSLCPYQQHFSGYLRTN